MSKERAKKRKRVECDNYSIELLFKFVSTNKELLDLLVNKKDLYELYDDINKGDNPKDIKEELARQKLCNSIKYNCHHVIDIMDRELRKCSDYLEKNCDHEWVTDYDTCWDPCGPTPKICKKCGL